MSPHEFEITIDRAGQVRIHMRGVKGQSCIEYAKWLSQVLGPIQSQQATSEYYEPDGDVRIDLRGECGR